MPLPPYPRGITRHPVVDVPQGLRLEENSLIVPTGARAAVAELIGGWELKRRAGFETPEALPSSDAEGVLAKRVLGIRFAEPVRVVWADASGFGYETRPGHPLHGEESFVLDPDGVFTARSVSCPSSLRWRMVAPALRILQRSTHRRYIRIVQDAVRRQGAPRQDG